MALDLLNSGNLEQLALKGLIVRLLFPELVQQTTRRKRRFILFTKSDTLTRSFKIRLYTTESLIVWDTVHTRCSLGMGY